LGFWELLPLFFSHFGMFRSRKRPENKARTEAEGADETHP